MNEEWVDGDDLGVERDLLVRRINIFSSRSTSQAKKGSDQVGRFSRSDSFERVTTLENKVQKVTLIKDDNSRNLFFQPFARFCRFPRLARRPIVPAPMARWKIQPAVVTND